MIFRNLTELQNSIRNSKKLKTEFLQDPESFILSAKERHPIWNKKVFLLVVGIVGAALILSMVVAAITVLGDPAIGKGKDGNEILLQPKVDDFFVMIGSAAIGALAGLLVPNPSG